MLYECVEEGKAETERLEKEEEKWEGNGMRGKRKKKRVGK